MQWKQASTARTSFEMAILDPRYGWAIDHALPSMLKELGCRELSPKEAALWLARERAKRILESGEDPLASIPYFHQLSLSADYPKELFELGFLDDAFSWMTEQGVRTQAHELLEELLRRQPREDRA